MFPLKLSEYNKYAVLLFRKIGHTFNSHSCQFVVHPKHFFFYTFFLVVSYLTYYIITSAQKQKNSTHGTPEVVKTLHLVYISPDVHKNKTSLQKKKIQHYARRKWREILLFFAKSMIIKSRDVCKIWEEMQCFMQKQGTKRFCTNTTIYLLEARPKLIELQGSQAQQIFAYQDKVTSQITMTSHAQFVTCILVVSA